MERPSQANRSALLDALGRVRDKVDEEGAHFARVEGEHAEAGGYVAKTREVRRVQKREKREADQRLALERAAAAAAASSRVGAQRRDAAGNVIAPAMGALDGLPPDVAAAALEIAAADAKAAELKERERKALAAMPKPQRGYDAAAAAAARRGIGARDASPAAKDQNNSRGGVSYPTTPTGAGAPTPGAGGCYASPGGSAPDVSVDTVHAAAAFGGARGPRDCAVCAGTADVAFTRETLTCARCALPVHPRCYGLSSAAEAKNAAGAGGAWMCWVCKDATDKGKANTPAVAAAAATALARGARPSMQEKMAMYRGVSCLLCPVQLGAFKQCVDGRWCHVVCAQWTPEIVIKDANDLQCVEGVQSIPKERANQRCLACGKAAGVPMRCSYGHCQTTFHPLCARQAGMHVRASDGTRPHYRAYCDKHSAARRERDESKGVPRASVPPPPELAPVTMTPGSWGGVAHVVAKAAAAGGGGGGNTPGDAGGKSNTLNGGGGEESSGIRRLRSNLQRVRGGMRKAVLKSETAKRGASAASSNSGGGNPPGGGETSPSVPKRARSGSVKGTSKSSGPSAGDGGGGEGRWPKRARRSGGAGATTAAAPAADDDGTATPVSRERMMCAGELQQTNAKLPSGFAYVPRKDA